MTEKEIFQLLEEWQLCEHFNDYDRVSEIEEILLKVGLDMNNNWEEILRSRGLI